MDSRSASVDTTGVNGGLLKTGSCGASWGYAPPFLYALEIVTQSSHDGRPGREVDQLSLRICCAIVLVWLQQ